MFIEVVFHVLINALSIIVFWFVYNAGVNCTVGATEPEISEVPMETFNLNENIN